MDDREYSEDRSPRSAWRTKPASISRRGTDNDPRRHRELPSRSDRRDRDTSDFEAPLARGEGSAVLEQQHYSRSQESDWRDRRASPSHAGSFESDVLERLPSSPRHHDNREPRRKEPAAVGASVSSRSAGKVSAGGTCWSRGILFVHSDAVLDITIQRVHRCCRTWRGRPPLLQYMETTFNVEVTSVSNIGP